jgi:hypothetical protein
LSKKPSFANLGSRLATKSTGSQGDRPGDAAEGAQASNRSEAGTVSGRAARQPDGRKGILVRARPEAWKALKLIALDGERTLQDVMTEAINDMLSKHGKPPVA